MCICWFLLYYVFRSPTYVHRFTCFPVFMSNPIPHVFIAGPEWASFPDLKSRRGGEGMLLPLIPRPRALEDPSINSARKYFCGWLWLSMARLLVLALLLVLCSMAVALRGSKFGRKGECIGLELLDLQGSP